MTTRPPAPMMCFAAARPRPEAPPVTVAPPRKCPPANETRIEAARATFRDGGNASLDGKLGHAYNRGAMGGVEAVNVAWYGNASYAHGAGLR